MLPLFRFVCILSIAFSTTLCSAQQMSSLFTAPQHNFGTVARGAKTEHIFTFTNSYQSDIFINSVRASCGCATPSIINQRVRPGEVGAIRAQFNTQSFVGQRGATITVQFASPVFTEVQLRVDGFVRRDIVFNPGEINWGTVDEGESKTIALNIAYAGRPDWKITKSTCTNPHMKLNLVEKQRAGQRIDYQLNVTLLGSATAGSIHESIIFETNDNRLRTVPLSMNGQIQSALTVSPSQIFLSDLKAGESVKKTVFIRGKKEFQLTTIQTSDPRIKVETTNTKAKFHRVPITIDTTGKSGEYSEEILIRTDLNGLSRQIKITGNLPSQ